MEVKLLKQRAKSQAKEAVLQAKEYGQTIKDTAKYMHEKKLCLETVPTTDCHVVLTFPTKTDIATLSWIEGILKENLPDLTVHKRLHPYTNMTGWYLTASFDSLMRGAEAMGISKAVKEEYGGGLMEFSTAEKVMFQGIEDEDTFFISQERQSILHYLLQNIRATQSEAFEKFKLLEGQPIFPKLLSKRIISALLPLHDKEALKKLEKSWVHAPLSRQPLDDIAHYFGIKVSIYFAYLGHYTKWLIFPAVLGLFVTFYSSNATIQDWSFIFFTIFNIIWASLFLETWKRRSAELAFHWGTLDVKHELLEDPRPMYYGIPQVSPVSGRMEPFYPAWKRNLFRYFVTVPVILLCMCTTFLIAFGIFELQEWVNEQISEGFYPKPLAYIPKFILAITTIISETIYKKIAVWLNNKENYRLQSSYENHLIAKLIFVQFINHFMSVTYVAFYLQDFGRLKATIATLFITKHVIGNITETVIPYIKEKLKVYRLAFKVAKHEVKEARKKEGAAEGSTEGSREGVSEGSPEGVSEGTQEQTDEADGASKKYTISQAEVESKMERYEDTFNDFLEMFIQFGYVTLFSSAFPLAAFWALVNNVIEIRSDAFKLCTNKQRPFGQHVQNIGSWQYAMEVIGMLGVSVNCALLGISGQLQDVFPMYTAVGIFLIVALLEHIILALKLGISIAIPDTPYWVQTELAKLEYKRRQALKKMEQETRDNIHKSIASSPVEELSTEAGISTEAPKEE
ncbi:putative anoctamin-8-like isoform X2 [Apostichopus japonicus]|uniref:Anoctamin n=1 Tax=Stichopus japonicus TaxID=307972 RepID=A0A2G8L1F8_STIJA|nr:putative anoctamin-8-like isoform X2 [Apostichopus japonicus]